MGKSTSATILDRHGVRVLDTDALAREAVEPGQPALEEIRRAFGERMLDGTGRLRRRELAEHIFADPAARRGLEGILHPRIRERWLSEVAEWRRQGIALGAVIIPLLFETEAKGFFDVVICVACTMATQSSRLSDRGWSDVQIRQRNEAQWPVERKMLQSDRVIWTEGIMELHEAQMTRLLEEGT
jgi:dephospho-CoA kinase